MQAGARRGESRQQWLAGAVIALGVVAPLTTGGWVLLLDWAPGPRTDIVSNALAIGDGVASSAVLTLFVALTRVGSTASWLPVLVAISVGAFGIAALTQGTTVRRTAAAALYTVNPVVFERLFVGHLTYLVGYALLPLAVRALLRGIQQRRSRASSLWLALLVACSLHFAWIGGLVALATTVSNRSWHAVRWFVAVAVTSAAASVYIVSPMIGRTDGAVEVGVADVEAYRTTADTTIGLFGNVAALYGLWRTHDVQLPKEVVPGWPIFLVTILMVAATGGWAGWKRAANRPLIKTVLIAGVAGYFIALGDQGPMGFVFSWMFDNLPGFAVMREPQKFIVLVALAYAVLFGFGVEHLVRTVTSRRASVAMLIVGCALPVLYTPTLFWGLGGQVPPSHYPESWYEADRLMGGGDGRILFLPWHQYMSFPFTGRVIANPADNFFRRDVIIGDNVELPNTRTSSTSPRSAYLEYLFDHAGELCAFGDLVTPLGVEYVVLSHTVDWRRYGWLDRQVDLDPVLERDDLTVYRNVRYRGPGFRAGEPVRAAHLGEVVGLSRSGTLSRRPVLVQANEDGPIGSAACEAPIPAGADGGVARRSLVGYEVQEGNGSWLVIPEPFGDTWRADGQPPRLVAGGVNGYPIGPGNAEVRFRTLRWVIAGYAISIGTVVTVATHSLWRWRRDRSPTKMHTL